MGFLLSSICLIFWIFIILLFAVVLVIVGAYPVNIAWSVFFSFSSFLFISNFLISSTSPNKSGLDLLNSSKYINKSPVLAKLVCAWFLLITSWIDFHLGSNNSIFKCSSILLGFIDNLHKGHLTSLISSTPLSNKGFFFSLI